MISLRKSKNRGHSQHDWLDSLHTFSFADYYDPEFMGFGYLRVINEDKVKPGMGFGRHSHQNMEIISYVVEGSLEHKDSMGTGAVIKPGEIQRMSAGSGVEHSEFNHSKTDPLHFLQIWIVPDEQGLQPSYEQKTILKENNKLILIGSSDGGEGAVIIHQNVNLYVAYLTPSSSIKYEFKNERKGWIQVVKGNITLNKQALSNGDGAAITQEKMIQIDCEGNAEFLFFDFA